MPGLWRLRRLSTFFAMNVLITGITGMIGSGFATETKKRGWNTYGVARSSAASRLAAVDQENVFRCDILDLEAMTAVFEETKPDIVIHMAAQAFNGMSWKAEITTHNTNLFGTRNVLYCARTQAPKAKVLVAGSSASYGQIQPEDCPLVEDRPLRPFSPYGVSKVVTESLGSQYAANYGMAVYLPRLFIHVGTGHPPATAIQNFARQLALIAAGKQEPTVRVGNLETRRDFIDVRDGVNAMLLLLEKGEPNVPVNICTGSEHKISDVLATLIDIAGVDAKPVYDEALGRPSDEVTLYGDTSRLKALGWTQRYSIRETLQAVFDDWVERVAA